MSRSDAEEWANRVYDTWYRQFMAEACLIAPPPTRTETIKHVWEHAREFWCQSNVEGKLSVVTDPLEAEFLFELIRYGDWFVIECEGVVVQKMPVIS